MKVSALDKTVAQLTAEVSVLQQCIDHLNAQRSAPKAPRKPRMKKAEKPKDVTF